MTGDKQPPGTDPRLVQALRREERLAEALRANLQRRKHQARARGAEATTSAEQPQARDPRP